MPHTFVEDFVAQMTSDDPFCKITLGKKTVKTSVKLGTIAPKWNEKFILYDMECMHPLPSSSDLVEHNDVIKFVLRDNLTIGKGHFFGEINIPVSNLKRNSEVDEWFSLCKRRSIATEVTGQLHLRLFYQVPSISFIHA